jgi:hypothetical protein
MGFFKNRKREERAEALEKFKRLIEQLRPEWALTVGDPVTLRATCPYGQETLEFVICWGRGSITDAGDLNAGSSGYERVSFSVRSPSVEMSLLSESWNRGDFKEAWNQPAFDWLASYGQNSAPLVALRQRRLKLKQGLDL